MSSCFPFYSGGDPEYKFWGNGTQLPFSTTTTTSLQALFCLQWQVLWLPLRGQLLRGLQGKLKGRSWTAIFFPFSEVEGCISQSPTPLASTVHILSSGRHHDSCLCSARRVWLATSPRPPSSGKECYSREFQVAACQHPKQIMQARWNVQNKQMYTDLHPSVHWWNPKFVCCRKFHLRFQHRNLQGLWIISESWAVEGHPDFLTSQGFLRSVAGL